jgi:hypothetical protein
MSQTRAWVPMLAFLAIAGSVSLAASRVSAQQQMSMAMPSVAITSPSSGATITGNTIDVAVKPANFTVECADVGKPGTSPMQGHVHAMVDGMGMAHLANMYCSDHFTISTASLKPGKHVLAVVLADDAHQMDSPPATVSFDYAPKSEQPLPKPEQGPASIAIISPKNGETVDRKFDVKLAVNGFHNTCDLEGRQDVAGYGHVHIFASQAGVTDKTAEPPMVAMMKTPNGKMMAEKIAKETGVSMDELKSMASMSMNGLLGMPCTSTIPVDLSTWHSGQARVLIMLANNDHMPAAGVTPAAVTVNLK